VTTVTELEQLRRKAIADPREEAAFLRALLGATLYAHLPLSDDSGKMHLVMFTRPDGLTVIPIFSDLAQAHAAAQGHVRVAAVPGCDLFEATRGATLMLDPNEVGMTLYPEEIAALLDEGRAALAPTAYDGPSLELFAPEPLRDGWLMDVLAAGLASIEAVRTVHLAAARPSGSEGSADRLLVVLEAPSRDLERAARAMAVAVEAAPRVPWLPIDLASYEPGETLPDGMADGLRRAWTRRLRSTTSDQDG
jgi:hypothetical protein